MNVEQAREISRAAHESLFAMIEQLQMPHIAVCQAVKVSEQVQEAGLSLCVGRGVHLEHTVCALRGADSRNEFILTQKT